MNRNFCITASRVLAMPSKRYEKRTIDYLTRAEIEALIGAADLTTWSGRRDRMLLLLALQTGLRVSELINLTCGDVALGTGAARAMHGQGTKGAIDAAQERLCESAPRVA